MNGSSEEEEDDPTMEILIGDAEDWPEEYSYGFGAPMKVICEILLDSQACDLPISWPKVLSGSTNAGKLLNCLESSDDPFGAYRLFYAVDGCSVIFWGGCDCSGFKKRSYNKHSTRS
jgi:hypothetical protein